ncbi:uncharacterized protein ACO6RY_18730 [Pungitius sinensis]
MELLRKKKQECGEVIGCRCKNPKSYELTMRSEEGKAELSSACRNFICQYCSHFGLHWSDLPPSYLLS